MITRKFIMTLLCVTPLFLLISASCSKKPEKAPEPQANAPAADTPAATPEQAQDKEEQPKDGAKEEKPSAPSKDEKETTDLIDDEEEESDDEDGECDTAFGKRHEIQGDLSQAKWAELEPTLPVSVLKVAPNQDVIEKLESTLNLNCSADEAPKTASDGSSAQIIICSKPNQMRTYGQTDLDGKPYDDVEQLPKGYFCKPENSKQTLCDPCSIKYADKAYLSLESPKDHHKRVYEIDSDLEFTEIVQPCASNDNSTKFTVVNVEPRPFMDTTGLYVRTLWRVTLGLDHASDSSDEVTSIYETWLFAGPKHRLVTHWVDTNSYHYREDSDSAENCEPEEEEDINKEENADEDDEERTCAKITESFKCSIRYMYYKSGKFVPVEPTKQP